MSNLGVMAADLHSKSGKTQSSDVLKSRQSHLVLLQLFPLEDAITATTESVVKTRFPLNQAYFEHRSDLTASNEPAFAYLLEARIDLQQAIFQV